MEGDPHSVLEGMMIGGYAIGCDEGVHLLPGRVPDGLRKVSHRHRSGDEAGVSRKNIFGSGFDFEIKLKLGAGAFVCGEETALMASIMGKARDAHAEASLSRR